MKGKSILCAVLLALLAAPASADYVSIMHNMINLSPDTYFDADSKILSWASSNANAITLTENEGALGGEITEAVAHLETYLTSFNPGTRTAHFSGGSFSLSFKRDGQGPYNISGPISGMIMHTDSARMIGGQGLFDAGTPYLPGSDVWPAENLSSIKSLTVKFLEDLPGGVNYDWSTSFTGRLETQYMLYPNESAAPEPTALALLLVGGLLFRARRRA